MVPSWWTAQFHVVPSSGFSPPSPADYEYLQKTGDTVHLHDVLTNASSPFLTGDKFVSHPPHMCVCVLLLCQQLKPHDSSVKIFWTNAALCARSWAGGHNRFLFSNTGWKKRLWLPAVCWPQICRIHEQPFQGTLNFYPHSYDAYLKLKWSTEWFFFCPISCGGIHLQLYIHFMTGNQGKYPNCEFRCFIFTTLPMDG